MIRKWLGAVLCLLSLSNFKQNCQGFTNAPVVSRNRPKWMPIQSSKRWETLASLKSGIDREDKGEYEWEVGDVYEDLRKLEFAITQANAEEDLENMERVEVLKNFANGRRPLDHDVKKFIFMPLGLALLLSSLMQVPITKPLARLITKCFDFQFWALTVSAPIVLLVSKWMSSPEPEPIQDEMKNLSPEYLDFVITEREDHRKSCRDHTLFLLEFWTSSVLGCAIGGLLNQLINFPKDRIALLWWSCTQLLTRLGAIAALHQYPNQLFQLLRPNQPRPIELFPTVLQSFVRHLFLLAPFSVASDLSKLFVLVRRQSLISLFATVSLLVLGASYRLVHDDDSSSFKMVKKWSLADKLVYFAAITAIWRKPLANLFIDIQKFPFRSLAHQYRTPYIALSAFSTCGIIAITPILGYVECCKLTICSLSSYLL